MWLYGEAIRRSVWLTEDGREAMAADTAAKVNKGQIMESKVKSLNVTLEIADSRRPLKFTKQGVTLSNLHLRKRSNWLFKVLSDKCFNRGK